MRSLNPTPKKNKKKSDGSERANSSVRSDGRELLLEPEFLYEGAVCAFVRALKVLEMLAAVSYEAEKSPTGVFILPILIQVRRKFLNTAREYRDLYFR